MLGGKSASQKKLHKKVTLFALFVSDTETFLIRPHVFNSNDGRNAAGWNAWFRKNYSTERPSDGEPGILTNILDGISARSSGEKHWRVARIIGWAPNDRSRIIRSAKPKARHKTKQKRRKARRVYTRR
jgi:hypothetical protein